jgi:hypothetical protein
MSSGFDAAGRVAQLYVDCAKLKKLAADFWAKCTCWRAGWGGDQFCADVCLQETSLARFTQTLEWDILLTGMTGNLNKMQNAARF